MESVELDTRPRAERRRELCLLRKFAHINRSYPGQRYRWPKKGLPHLSFRPHGEDYRGRLGAEDQARRDRALAGA